MSAWSDWKNRGFEHASPYVEWEMEIHEALGTEEATFQVLKPEFLTLPDFDTFTKDQEHTVMNNTFPIPKNIANAHFDFRLDSPRALNNPLGVDDVVVGVIDIDVAFGNRVFRETDGTSRVLAAWQQGAQSSQDKNNAIPFGQELKHAEIQSLLAKHSARGHLTSTLDHDAFYKDVGLIHETARYGMGGLAKRSAHGTHVMGAAAGIDPAFDDDGFSQKVKLLVVNLPPPPMFGEGGAFLDDYLAYGLRWIVRENAKMRRVNEPNTSPPLFINISFGKQAGGRDTTQQFVTELSQATVRRRENRLEGSLHFRPPTIFLPAGNDNLERCRASFRLKSNEKTELHWRVQPDDATSNFVEIWGEEKYTQRQINSDLLKGLSPIAIEVIPPETNTEVEDLAQPKGRQVRHLKDGIGSIFFDWIPIPNTQLSRPRYIICLSPTGRLIEDENPAPAGAYTIVVHNRHPKKSRSVSAHIQTDEATIQFGHGARRSYFEDASYQLFEDDGRTTDTFYNRTTEDYNRRGREAFKPVSERSRKVKYVDEHSMIERKGTLNSYSQNDSVTVIGGYRSSDGRPALYSSSGAGKQTHYRDRGAPTASLPSDDGYAHFGTLSDGAKDGSAVAMRGTSFACAAATRLAIELFLDTSKPYQDEFRAWDRIKKFENPDIQDSWGNIGCVTTKVGETRIPYRKVRRTERM